MMIEAPKIIGPIPKMISETLSYLRTNVIKRKITKLSDSEQSIKVFNYPYQALEEAVVNALYHRDYQEREPVEITIEPTHIDILSYAGPDRSISAEAIKAAKKLKARRYRNRRLGDFLKELGLTEGRATGVPTIQKHLGLNGNNLAVIETDDDRTYFLMTIPCRKDMVNLSKTDDGDQDSTTSIQEIILLIKKELANLSLQVYSIDTEDIDLLSSRLAKLISQVYLQVWEKIRRPWSFLISDVIRTFLLLSIKDTAASDLLKESHTESLYKFKRYILEPAISAGYIEMSDPDKPRSSKQGYRLTQSGRLLFNS